MKGMRLRYDPVAGAIYFRLVEGEIEETVELPSPGCYADLDADGRVMGLEFLSVQEFLAFLTAAGGELEVPERIEDPDGFAESVRKARDQWVHGLWGSGGRTGG